LKSDVSVVVKEVVKRREVTDTFLQIFTFCCHYTRLFLSHAL